VALAGTLAFVQLTVPPAAPTPGVVQLQTGPELWEKETKVILPGSESLKLELSALFGPLLKTAIV
jgi:hypothetical protein